MFKFLKKIKQILLDLIFPIECLNCRQEGDYFCATCFEKIKINNNQEVLALSHNLNASYLNKIFIAGNYDDKLLNNLIIKYKYNFLSPLSRILSKLLINFWEAGGQETKTLNFKIPKLKSLESAQRYLVIPIPLSKKRLNWRGFNQAELLARDFSAHFNYELNHDLKRQKYKYPQAKLSEQDRLKNLKDAFLWTGDNLEGLNVLLLDDVITTGTTLNEAAKVLKAAGATKVSALVLAKG